MKKLECFKADPFFLEKSGGGGRGYQTEPLSFSFNMMGLLTCALFFV